MIEHLKFNFRNVNHPVYIKCVSENFELLSDMGYNFISFEDYKGRISRNTIRDLLFKFAKSDGQGLRLTRFNMESRLFTTFDTKNATLEQDYGEDEYHILRVEDSITGSRRVMEAEYNFKVVMGAEKSMILGQEVEFEYEDSSGGEYESDTEQDPYNTHDTKNLEDTNIVTDATI